MNGWAGCRCGWWACRAWPGGACIVSVCRRPGWPHTGSAGGGRRPGAAPLYGRGGRALPAGAAVVAGAFTAVLALQRLPVDDALGLSWTAGLWAAAPGAVVASVAWNVGQPVLGMVLLAAGRRLDRRPAEAAEAATRPRRATVTARETRPGERVPWTAAPQPRAQREVDGQP